MLYLLDIKMYSPNTMHNLFFLEGRLCFEVN